MKLLAFTDLHWRGDSPRARKDNYPEAAGRKLGEIRDLAEAHQVKAVLFGGDLTDKTSLDNGPIGDLGRALKRFSVPIMAVEGNTHDLIGDNPATLRRTPLGIMAATGCIELLQPGAPVILEEHGFTVQITGQGFHGEMDRRDWRLDYCVYTEGGSGVPEGHQHWRDQKATYAIHIVHGMLRTLPLMAGIPVTLVQDVLNRTQANVTISGHDHNGYGIVGGPDGRWACNPGAVMRCTAASEEIERPVEVLLITIDASGCKGELIPLQSAAPGADVLDRTKLDQDKATEASLAEFLVGVKVGGEFETLDIQKLILRMAEAKSVPAKVKDAALGYVRQAQEAIDRKAALEEAV